MHNHRVLGNQAPNGGFSRFQALHGDNNLAVWLRQAGYYTAMIGKYLNGYVFQPARAARLVGVARAPRTRRSTATRSNENGTMVRLRPGPRRLQAGRPDPQGGGPRRPPGADGAAVLPLAHLHGPARRRAAEPEPAGQLPRGREAGAAPRPRVRLRAAAEAPELQRGRRLRQAGQDPQPPAVERGSDRGHPAQVPLRAGVAAVGGRGRQEGRRCAEGEGRARQHGARSTPPTTATSTASTGSPRTSSTSTRSRSGCRSDARPGHPAGGEGREPRDQRRPGADDRRRWRTRTPACRWTGAR